MTEMSSSTWLFVPGDRPERFAKAAASGADEIVIDLEDAVTDDHKPTARNAAAAWLSNGPDQRGRHAMGRGRPHGPRDHARIAGRHGAQSGICHAPHPGR
jgi:citrate lyase subunit beta/citryl-CoA lyase